jgi:hypothetical protein
VTTRDARRRTTGAAAAALALLVLTAAPRVLAVSRTFVASFGVDTNPCALTFPCRSFAAALAVTDSGGEIVVLDSAGYGAVSIGKSVSITVPAGIYAGVSVPSGDGITVNGAGVRVAIRNLTVNGQGGTHGVRFVQGASLEIVGCQIVGMSGNGIHVEGAGTVVVRNTAIRGSGQDGVYANAAATVTLVRSRIQSSSGNGFTLGGGAAGSAARTLIFDSGLFGVAVSQTAAGTARVALDDVVVSDNDGATGVYAEGIGASAVAQIELRRSLVTRNFTGVFALSQSGGLAAIGATGNAVTENSQNGLATTTLGGTATIRTSRNGVFRNQLAGLLPGSGTIYTPCTGALPCSPPPKSFTNYVSDNDAGDDFGAQPDSLM